MNRGLYTAAIGMMTQMNKMDVVTNNIANANTTGFKKDVDVIQSFSEELMYRLNDSDSLISRNNQIGSVSLGNFTSEIYTDFSSGSLEKTEGTYDLAISGDGFFTISYTTESGETTEKYTRDGSFTLNSQGLLVTSEGYKVLGENGEIAIPNGIVTISENGYIYCDGEYVDRLKLVNVENTETLRKIGDNLYSSTDETVFSQFSGGVIQSYLEGSNVNVVEEMVKIISLSRVYEANSQMIKTQDSIMQKAVSQIGNK